MRELNVAALAAGLSAFVWYACGALPLQLGVAAALGMTTGSVCIVWASGAVSSIVLSARLRQPIPITWSIPGLVYVGSVAGRFSAPDIAGAVLVAAIILGVLALGGAGSRMARWLPMPILMGTFGGSLLEYMHRAVTATVADFAIAGSIVGAYFAARLAGHPRLPPVGVALLAGLAALALNHADLPATVEWQLPALAVPQFGFDPAAITAISLPLVVLSLGLGNAQALGFLASQGYAVPVEHPANARYWGVQLSSLLVLAMACVAGPFAALIAAVPQSFVIALAGVALVAALQDARERAFTGNLRFGALIAFIVAATPSSSRGSLPHSGRSSRECLLR